MPLLLRRNPSRPPLARGRPRAATVSIWTTGRFLPLAPSQRISTGHATTIFGLVNGTDPITGLSTYAGADNNLYATGAWVTFGGLSFSSTSLGDFNFYNSGFGYYGLLSSRRDITGYADGTVALAHVAPVPEPTTWAMMLLGFGAAGATLRRQRRPIKLAQVA